MTIEELKEYFNTVSLPNEIQITVDMHIFDLPKFLQANLAALDRWNRELEKCPSYVRLINLKKAIENQ
ncbi:MULTISPECIES: DUF6965 family protein [Sphingobacterium]|jgi:hypothetical protein|uniref:DUF6965 family protein n=2 Tax=Sphingobacterium TaxID=28453 RepID=A0ABW5YQP7_9SPHI|nr:MULTISPECIES: hypothetical protein [Sphingobacterium]KKX49668.1 hypothetical protein L950_0214425 [Sphingobacterium sp. IITKGP-BTPF85]MBB2951802.1 hypothetical protein [Sphingobacterium sp. JUb56]MCS3557070.1 hypothetical protein [Sphingobacterium sp. JUb21]MCW2260314.1 hypothetical protein [Sphingobacterium kitahiroshimense]NJI71783.1 hypothetical protein [Sphingobacterium sp. B16(2022)]